MKMQLNTKTRIGDIQYEFRKCFPYLKIEFFNYPDAWEQKSEEGFNYNPAFKLYRIAGVNINDGEINISRGNTPGEVEEMLYKNFDLIAQVYRKFEGNWILTNGSDDTSLNELNELASQSAMRPVFRLQESMMML